jgi:ParB-like chromosome segregation protein Spo0J
MSFDFGQYKVHPVCSLFPEMTEREYEELSVSIITYGLKHPIVLAGDTIADGRTRFRICMEHGIEPRFQQLSELLDPTQEPELNTVSAWIIATNLKRRSLTEDQKAVIGLGWYHIHEEEAEAIKKATQLAGRNKEGSAVTSTGDSVRAKSPEPNGRDHKADEANRADSKTAKAVGVTQYKVRQAKRIAEASPALLEEVKQGKLTAAAAEKIINEGKPVKPKKQKQQDDAVSTASSSNGHVAPEPSDWLMAEFQSRWNDVMEDFLNVFEQKHRNQIIQLAIQDLNLRIK